MSKEELALELTKLSYKDVVHAEGNKGNYDAKKIVADLYNHIFSNLQVPTSSEQQRILLPQQWTNL